MRGAPLDGAWCQARFGDSASVMGFGGLAFSGFAACVLSSSGGFGPETFQNRTSLSTPSRLGYSRPVAPNLEIQAKLQHMLAMHLLAGEGCARDEASPDKKELFFLKSLMFCSAGFTPPETPSPKCLGR